MKILFATNHAYIPQWFGGLQISTDQLCKALQARGHSVAVLAGRRSGGSFALRQRLMGRINGARTGHRFSRNAGQGYQVWYAPRPESVLSYVVSRERPDLLVLMSNVADPVVTAASSVGVPVLIQFHDVDFGMDSAVSHLPRNLGLLNFVANSSFTANKYRERYGIDPSVIYPFIAADEYRTPVTGRAVTFVNPYPAKGLRVAIEVARSCPTIPFSFVESWPLSVSQRRELMFDLSSIPNVQLIPRQTDMRNVYERSRLLLVPSICEEAFGRVAAEAQISGIPVVASHRGGLPEAIGTGGILVDPDGPIDGWVTAVENLWNDDELYSKVSSAALSHAQRPEMNFAHQVDQWEKAFIAAVARQ